MGVTICDLEFIALSINSRQHNVKHCFSVLYRPPSSPVSSFDNFGNMLHNLSPHSFTSFVLVGDFNIDFFKVNHPYFCKIHGLLTLFSLSQIVTSPTHVSPSGISSLIDLALVSDATVVHEYSTIPPIANSDHNGIKLQLNWKLRTKHTSSPRLAWYYNNADFKEA